MPSLLALRSTYLIRKFHVDLMNRDSAFLFWSFRLPCEVFDTHRSQLAFFMAQSRGNKLTCELPVPNLSQMSFLLQASDPKDPKDDL